MLNELAPLIAGTLGGGPCFFYARKSLGRTTMRSDIEAAGLIEVEQHRPGIVQQGEDPQRTLPAHYGFFHSYASPCSVR